MRSKPTAKQLNDIEQLREHLSEELQKASVQPFTATPSRYGEELLEDTQALLSILPHQALVESSMRDFHSNLAKQILADT